MAETDVMNVVNQFGGIAGAIMVFFMAFMKVWKTFYSDKLSTVKDSTESTLITSLMADIERVKNEMKEMKAQHKGDLESLREQYRKNREDFLLEIASLKHELGIVKKKNESMRAEALEAYAYISNSNNLRDKAYVEDLKDRLMRIAVEDVPTKSSNA